jgi:indole-3-glycerol phosphate synthase
MGDILQTILAAKAGEVEQARQAMPLAALQSEVARMAQADPPRDFIAALDARIAAGQAAVIAEIKKASPSQGVIRAKFDVEAIARSYAANGAACLSVLTDEQFFQGRGAYLALARRACALPALRKDFVIDAYQVWQSRALGADCILLIAAALDDRQLHSFAALARELGMAALVEVHDAAELARAAAAGAMLIGVNNRNLRTFETTLSTSEALAPLIPRDRLMVGESGIFAPADLARLERVGMSTFLVGESLMRQADVTAATRALLARADAPRATGTR